MLFGRGSNAGARSGETEAFFVHSPDLLAVLGADGTLRSPNPAWGRLLGRPTEQVQGRPFTDLLVAEDRAQMEIALARLRRGEEGAFEARSLLRDGSVRWVHWILVNADGRILVSGRDATERKQVEDRLRYDALQDAVTGLGNRNLLLDRVRRLLLRARQGGGGFVGILYVDLEGFSALNERMGHSAADLLLFSVARRLETSVRPGDLVCRVGGDAFGLVLDGVRGEDDAILVANRVFATLEPAFIVAARSIAVSAHVGVAVSGADQSADELLDEAERRQVRARTEGVRLGRSPQG